MIRLTIVFALVLLTGCKTDSVIWYRNYERNFSIRLDVDAGILDFNIDFGHFRGGICGYEFQELNDSVLVLTQIDGPRLQENAHVDSIDVDSIGVDSIYEVKRTETCYIDNDTIFLKDSGAEIFVSVFGEKIAFSRWDSVPSKKSK